jgi:hypothetical protein
LGSDPVGQTNTSRGPKPPASLTSPLQGDDQVDMSKLSTLMARTAKDLEARFAVRQDKVNQFRDDLNTPPNLSDEVIDTMWRHMLGR